MILMSNNQWKCDTNKWRDIGDDCSAEARVGGLVRAYKEVMPDVLGLQEVSEHMADLMMAELQCIDLGDGKTARYSHISGGDTPIVYRSDKLKLLESGFFLYSEQIDGFEGSFNNHESKSYCFGVFEDRETGKRFALMTTHLWWKSETAQAGSDEMRERQAAEIVAEADSLIAKYGVPVWVMGDFNTRTTSAAFRVFTSGGFKDAFDIATAYADDNSGYHTCTRQTFARETQLRPYKSNAIDHILFKNPGATEGLTFNHIRPYFYIKLSDHYPLYADAKLG